ncbi:MAG: endonuclease MutS2, partial [Chitinophagales bacterium]
MTYYKKNKFKTDLYPKDIFEKLEFDKILELLTEKCYSPLGKKYVEHLKVQTNPELIQKMLIQVNEFKQMLLYEEQQLPNNNFLDLKEELDFLSIQNAVLSEQQVFRVFKVLLVVIELVRYFEGVNNERIEKYPNLYNLVEKVSISRALINEIKKVLDKEGRIRSDASKELKQIRKQITNKYRDLDRRFVSVVNEYKKNGWLADNLESVRNGRRVLAVRAEHKRKIRGIIHDESQTGSTTFIEPDSTLRINNEIVEFQQAERREIYRILQILTKALQPYHEELAQYQKLLGLIDFIRAKGRLAWELQAQMPHISPQKNIELYNARHPLLFLKKQKDTVPLSLNLSLSERILLVSGPNAGGKSVLLKTVGLLQLMLQTGMLVPVDDHSVMSIFRNIYVDIGDEQSIENDLSTYSSRLKNMRYYCDFANNKTLMLIDEFGSGTDPALGGAIAEAILEHLNKKFCYGVITTHYSNLKVYATRTTGIINGAMAFDYKTLSPKYKLEIGKPGSSFAFELAVKSGLKADLIEVAKSKVDANYKEFDELLSTMQREKQEVMERERIVSN